MSTPRIAGLDLSMTATGVARADGTTATIKPRGAGDRRLLEVRDGVWQVVKGCRLVVLEDMPTRLLANAAKTIGFVHGAVRSLLLEEGIPYAAISPATLKVFATGKGNADKTAMAIAALKRAGAEFADDNQCDAAWLRWAGLDWLGHPEVTVPQTQRGRLTKVDWPVVPR